MFSSATGCLSIMVEILGATSLTEGKMMDIEFTEKIIFWRGPAPWFFVPVPAQQSREINRISRLVTYGWGVIPVHVRIGKTTWQTSLFPKEDRYLVPIKASVRKAEQLEEGESVTVRLEIRLAE